MPRSYHVYVGCSFPLLDHSTCVTRAKFAFPVRRHHSLRTVAKIILVLVLMEQHKNILHTEVTILWRHTNLFIIFFNLFLFYFIYLFFVFMYVRNGYDRNSETVNMLARHTALKRWIATEICWYRNIVSRGSAVESMALLPISDHCPIVWGIQLSTPNNLGGTWRRICSLDTRGDSALEVLRNRAL